MLGYHDRYHAKLDMKLPNYSTILLSTVGAAFLAGFAILGTFSLASASEHAEPLPGGQREISSGAILSWEVDAESRIFFARVHNNTNEASIVQMDPDELEAVIAVIPFDGADSLNYVHKEYARRMRVAFWIPSDLKIEPGSAHNWTIPFSNLRQILSGPIQSFDEAIKSGTVEIVGLHGSNFRYDEQGRFDGFN